MLCCFLLFVSVVKPSCYSTVLQYRHLLVVQTLSYDDFVVHNAPIRQLSPSLLSDNCGAFICLVLWIHNPAWSGALRRWLPFLQKPITVTCKRFSTQHLSKPNHVSNCVGPAWLGVGRLTSICDSHPCYFIRALNFPSNTPCSCQVYKVKQWLWTMACFQKLCCHRTSWPMFTCSVEQRNLCSSRAWNRKKLNPQWRILETVCLSIHSPSIQSLPVKMVWQN